ncbi:MAG TPA: DUF2304 family protein [Deltaproteobacteria bacterium]|nr:DUF2304 family protein [Deltaproteobacteria bacterium]
MSALRITGLLLSLLVAAFAAVKYRQGRFKHSDLFIGLVVSFALLLVSLKPDAANVVADVLTGRYRSTNRIVSILIVSNIFTVLLIFWLMLRSNAIERSISELVGAMALSSFQQEFGDRGFEKKILVVIPAYNEAENLGRLLPRIPGKISGYDVETVVVVDGATDDTEEVARRAGVYTVVNRINRGGGAALRAGYKLALAKNAEIVVTMDADGQHRPEEIERLVEPIIAGEADFTSGSRVLGSQEKESPVRQLGIVLFNRLISLLLWRRITDCSNAFRALRVSECAKLDLRQDQFHTTELIIDAVSKGIRFKEVPVTVLRRQGGVTKKPPSLRYGWGFLKAIVTTWWRT